MMELYVTNLNNSEKKMLKYTLALASVVGLASASYATEVPITGTVQSKCSIYTDTAGVYGSPSPDKLSTQPADGGVHPIVRVDVSQAGYYLARVTTPNSFSSSPPLNDAINFTGTTAVHQVSDAQMSAYETNKVAYNNVTEFDLTVAGSVWFKSTSTAEYGVNKSFPGGTYRAVVLAECIAK
jgi:hypothetical protein